MRKKFKSKKRYRLKSKIKLIIIILSLLLMGKIINNYDIKSNKDLLNFILKSSTNSYLNLNIDFLNPKNILKSTIFYSANKTEEKLDEPKLEVTSTISDKPIVYIYNSHQGETYSSKYMEDYNILPDVLMASNMFKEKLEELNIHTLVENSNILEYMKKNKMNHSQSYKASRFFLKKAISDNIKLYIDLHRDAAKHKTTYVNIDGKDCARVMFVIGLEYDTYESNLKVVTKINNIINKKYPKLSRGILKKKGAGVNGIYNQDLNPNIILIELGGNENNINEVNNTLEILANVIGEYLNENI